MGPLYYMLQNAGKMQFKAYFKNSEVIIRYLKLAQAERLLENGNYKILLEPIFQISACSENFYSGRYTISDLGRLSGVNKIEFNTSVLQFPSYLALETTSIIGGFTYEKPDAFIVDGKPRIFKVADFSSELGIGMAVINSKEIAKRFEHYQIICRTISLKNPFLDSNGKKRSLDKNSNWYGKENTIDYNI